jgi:KDO2-lipid IV(A) lauroyltransferase
VPRLRKVGWANLDLAYGDSLTRGEKRRTLRGAAENLGIVAAEFTHADKLAGEAVRDLVTVKGLEHVDRSRGSLVISAHLSNWEWMGPALAGLGIRLAAVARPLDDPRLNLFVDEVRRATGMNTVPKKGAAPELLRLLKEGWMVLVLIDQSPRTSAVPVRFFGQPCWATIGPVMAGLRAGVPVHALCMIREPDGRYTLELSPALSMTRSGDLHRDLVENTQRCQDAIETMVRAHPEQWLWFHRRWKPRPRLEHKWSGRGWAHAED